MNASTTLPAGSGEPGVADGPAQEATLTCPIAIAVGPGGSIRINHAATAEAKHPVVIRQDRGDGPVGEHGRRGHSPPAYWLASHQSQVPARSPSGTPVMIHRASIAKGS